jgi:Ca2+-transporting ATPase
MAYYKTNIVTLVKEFQSSDDVGISDSCADERLKIYGKNQIKVREEPFWKKILEPFTDIFMLVLVGAIAISIFEKEIIDAIVISMVIVVDASIYYIQRFSTEHILKSIQDKEIQSVTVIRSGIFKQIPALELVPGDLISLHEGERVPADCRIIRYNNLRVNESSLTGESNPVGKNNLDISDNKEIYDQKNMLFQETFIVSGETDAIVVATANQTEFGRIALLTEDSSSIKSPVQKKIDSFLAKLIFVIIIITVIAFILDILNGANLPESLRFVIALAVSAVPEELPIATSIILALGVRNISKKKALIRNIPTIQTIGSITTIATDKTGTLTENKLDVAKLWENSGKKINDINFIDIIYGSINKSRGTNDPLDQALAEYAKHNLVTDSWVQKNTISFIQKHQISGNTYKLENHKLLFIFKGSPESITHKSDMSDSQKNIIKEQLYSMTTSGYRVIAFAAIVTDENNLNNIDELFDKNKLIFYGLVALSDKIRSGVKKAILEAQAAGITVRMVTGDHAETAYQIAKQLNIVSSRDQVFDARHIDNMTEVELNDTLEKTFVYARVLPDDKYKILSILKRHNITAMTGDGVNDVPALTNAHVGISMGSGTQIAKDSSDMILLDDNFATIVSAVKEGRTIIKNIEKMLYYLLATNTGEVLTMLGSLILGLSSPLSPIQILWINIATDTTLVVPLGLEPAESNVMNERPYQIDRPLFSKTTIIRMIIIAITTALITISIYYIFKNLDGYNYASAMAFNSLIMVQWANVICARSQNRSVLKTLKIKNKPLFFGLSASIIMQFIIILTPVSTIFEKAQPKLQDILIVGLISSLIIIFVSEISRIIFTRSKRQ